MLKVIYGPPGTGKTTYLMAEIERHLKLGVLPGRIGYCSFTKAAVEEARLRASKLVPGADFVWFRTLNSFGHHMIKRPVDDAKRPKVKPEMEKKYGYLADYAGYDAWSQIRRRVRSMDEAYDVLTARYSREIRDFVIRYESVKEQFGVIDYEDQILLAVNFDPPDLDVLIVDEAQDLNLPQISLFEHLSRFVQKRVVAGDDDQAIMAFQGATAQWLIALEARADEVVKLGQSWRIPSSVHHVADAIISRVSHRVVKAYAPKSETGEVVAMNSLDLALSWANGAECAILCRWGGSCSNAARELFKRRVPYFVERGPCGPLQQPKLMDAVKALAGLQSDGRLTYAGLSLIVGYRTGHRRGLKTAIRQQPQDARVTDGFLADWGLLDEVQKWARATGLGRYAAIANEPAERMVYLGAVLDDAGELAAHPVVVTTMHAAKGREWDVVIVDDQLPFPSVQALDDGDEDEHRVAYVAVTRARRGLCVLTAGTLANGAGRYRYPIPRAGIGGRMKAHGAFWEGA